jgi:hypothetical protein
MIYPYTKWHVHSSSSILIIDIKTKIRDFQHTAMLLFYICKIYKQNVYIFKYSLEETI